MLFSKFTYILVLQTIGYVSKDESFQVNMITKEFKSVLVLVILGDIVAKKGFSLVKNIYCILKR